VTNAELLDIKERKQFEINEVVFNKKMVKYDVHLGYTVEFEPQNKLSAKKSRRLLKAGWELIGLIVEGKLVIKD